MSNCNGCDTNDVGLAGEQGEDGAEQYSAILKS
jgi:hypothetical protein